jgi:transcriptional regulator with XRE-family HTH domain
MKNSILKSKKITNKELAKRFNITEQTYNNWKKNKPELIKVVEFGLEFEEILKNHCNENNLINFNKK